MSARSGPWTKASDNYVRTIRRVDWDRHATWFDVSDAFDAGQKSATQKIELLQVEIAALKHDMARGMANHVSDLQVLTK
jgi:hypothetical protein